ncbi:MAG: hypothetical protein BWY04_00834 [candidate division CPR1 bacterium ADurb.Bin160]|uniref:Uncharacterized protein n=1 Tax=candidate division CPR1 bacterium ADurb.Bin160 TaxID=1852826 RepID=A0A1V5ZN11_9BACT|nr:MAG: hypothetical protein BWY04_00834 [candidate division CPR1 bacterium ADurb.Bin160]
MILCISLALSIISLLSLSEINIESDQILFFKFLSNTKSYNLLKRLTLLDFIYAGATRITLFTDILISCKYLKINAHQALCQTKIVFGQILFFSNSFFHSL